MGPGSPAGVLGFSAHPSSYFSKTVRLATLGYNHGRHHPAAGLALLRGLEGNPETSGGADGLGKGGKETKTLQ